MTLPLTILGGFLGAGKTTLVNHLLRNADGLRLAVLVNEFGDLPIDADLIEAQDDDLISIAGGCVCCSYGNDMTLALLDLAKMDPPPDHVVLEASGVAIPGAISGAVGLLNGFRMDGVVVLADAETLRQNADDPYMGDTVMRQLKDADLILLNKCDLISTARKHDVQEWLEHTSPTVQIVETEHAAIDPAVVLGSFLDRPRNTSRPHGVNPVKSVLLHPGPVADVPGLAAQLASSHLGLIRAKGYVSSIDGSHHLVQIVGRRWQVTPALSPSHSGIVCLGVGDHINADALQTLQVSVAD